MSSNAHTLEAHYRRSDRLMVTINWILLVLALGLANWHNTWSEALVIGLPAAVVPTALLFIAPGTLISRVANAAAFMIFSALHIHQGHGMIELHFGIFVLLAFLLYYRDWMPIVAAAGVIAVHHLSFNFLQASDAGVYVFANRTGLDLVIIHAAYVVFESALLIYMAVQGKRETVQNMELQSIATQLTVVDNRVDLTFRQDDARSDFAIGFNNFMDVIQGAISKTQLVAGQLSDSAGNMSHISSAARTGSRRQQQETEQVASAIQEMTHTVESVSGSAGQAVSDARTAQQAASNGSAVVNQSIQVINKLATKVEHASKVIQKLDDESHHIGSVLDVIKGIAEQTNLLALNAAIEAARAGEQGRGFAVVADEVRTLASRTQQSTAEIEEMIERLQSGAKEAVAAMQDGTTHAHEGVSQVESAGQALGAITAAIATILDMNTQIAHAAEEQQTVAEEINRNITTISTVAAETALGVSQVSDAGLELDRLSRELQEQMRRFDA